jgi:hypothetical protein
VLIGPRATNRLLSVLCEVLPSQYGLTAGRRNGLSPNFLDALLTGDKSTAFYTKRRSIDAIGLAWFDRCFAGWSKILLGSQARLLLRL